MFKMIQIIILKEKRSVLDSDQRRFVAQMTAVELLAAAVEAAEKPSDSAEQADVAVAFDCTVDDEAVVVVAVFAVGLVKVVGSSLADLASAFAAVQQLFVAFDVETSLDVAIEQLDAVAVDVVDVAATAEAAKRDDRHSNDLASQHSVVCESHIVSDQLTS